MDFHIHYTLPSDSAADRIKFQLDVAAAGANEDFAVPAGSPYSAEYVLVGNESARHNKFEVASIPAVNTTVSTIYACRLTRVAAAADDYASEVYLIFADCHYQKDTVGSIQEFSKV